MTFDQERQQLLKSGGWGRGRITLTRTNLNVNREALAAWGLGSTPGKIWIQDGLWCNLGHFFKISINYMVISAIFELDFIESAVVSHGIKHAPTIFLRVLVRSEVKGRII